MSNPSIAGHGSADAVAASVSASGTLRGVPPGVRGNFWDSYNFHVETERQGSTLKIKRWLLAAILSNCCAVVVTAVPTVALLFLQ